VVAAHANETVKLLGPLGAEVMEVLWSAGEPMAVRAVMDRLNRGRADPLAYTTVSRAWCGKTNAGGAGLRVHGGGRGRGGAGGA
jgi:hypothetical protein